MQRVSNEDEQERMCTSSRREDYQLVQQLPEQEREGIYNDLKAAAESGWDFSYRWCIRTDRNANLSLINVSTSDIIPVDLNAILQRNARLLARFHGILGNPEVSLSLNYLSVSIASQTQGIIGAKRMPYLVLCRLAKRRDNII